MIEQLILRILYAVTIAFPSNVDQWDQKMLMLFLVNDIKHLKPPSLKPSGGVIVSSSHCGKFMEKSGVACLLPGVVIIGRHHSGR